MSKIEWTDKTVNPLRRADDDGNYCEKISPGCAFCFASELNSKGTRFGGNGKHFGGVRPDNWPKMTLNIEMLHKWQRIRKPRKIFVGSMTDIFGEWVSDWMIFAMLDAMVNSIATYQLLTKRPERMCNVVGSWLRMTSKGQLPANIWIGTSAENQHCFNERSTWLHRTLGQVRFLSLEPLLGPITIDFYGIDWAIIGGESGPNARPIDGDWVLDILEQCRSTNTPAFVKQLGSYWARLVGASDSKGGNPDEWPGSLGAGVRMFPGEVWEK